MIDWVLKRIIGTKNQRELKKAWPKVAAINALEGMTAADQLQIQRLKKRKLLIKDRITAIERLLEPDDYA